MKLRPAHQNAEILRQYRPTNEKVKHSFTDTSRDRNTSEQIDLRIGTQKYTGIAAKAHRCVGRLAHRLTAHRLLESDVCVVEEAVKDKNGNST